MANKIPTVNKVNTGLCPHGLPPSACPICSGGMGGMRSNKPRRSGEMTYHECAMAGNAIRARKAANKEHKQTLDIRLENFKNFEITIAKISLAIKELAKNFSNNFVTKPIAFVLNRIVLPVINLVKNISRFVIQIQNIKFEITDKLNAIYGEAKAFVEKKISELIKVLKTDIKSLFKIFRKNNTKDDDTKIDEDKKIFNLKTILHKIIRKKNKKDEQNSTNK